MHLGVADETIIENMGYDFFEDVLAELNYKLTYDAIRCYAGNGFFEKSWDLITEHHPLLIKEDKPQQAKEHAALSQLAGLFG